MNAVVEMRPRKKTVEQWAEVIRGKWQESIDAIFETALYLETAHEELGPKGWLEMVEQNLGWSKQTAYKLLKIVQDDKLAQVAHARLPASWMTLHELTRLSEEQFQRGLQTGAIHPAMERKDVAKLKSSPQPVGLASPTTAARKPAPPAVEHEPLRGQELVERRAMEMRQAIVRTLKEMAPSEQAEFLALLRLQIDDLEAKRAGGAK